MEQIEILNLVVEWVSQNKVVTSMLGAVFASISGTGIFAYLRLPKAKEASQGKYEYFTQTNLMNQPSTRPAYSDRTAYVMAEMSALAYFNFESPGIKLKEVA